MGTYPCDRCDDGDAAVAIWDDDVLCGRIDTICDACYERGERIDRPIEPPYDEDGEMYYHVRLVKCSGCGWTHEVKLTDQRVWCPRKQEHFEYCEENIVEAGI